MDNPFDATLTKYILLASFMPIISAISGNTGLQSAAIIIRGLSTGHVQLSHWRHAVIRQAKTTMLLGGSCALVLCLIGAVWDKHWVFGEGFARPHIAQPRCGRVDDRPTTFNWPKLTADSVDSHRCGGYTYC